MLPDGRGQILQLIFIEMTTWVPLATSNELYRNGAISADSTLGFTHGYRLVHFADQGRETTSQPALGKIITHKISLRRLRQTSGGFTQTLSLDHFRCELQIGLTTSTFQIIKNCRLTIRWGLGNANIARNECMVNLFSEMCPDIRDNLLRQIIACIEHRQNNPLDIELRIDRPSYLADCIKQLAKAFQRKKLALQWHQHGMRGRHCVHRQEVEGRGAVDKNIRIASSLCRLHRFTQKKDAIGNGSNLHLETKQIHRRWHDIEIWNGGWDSHFRNIVITDQEIIRGELPLSPVDPQPGAGVTLRVQINYQYPLTDGCQRCGQIDSSRCFTNPTLLVCYCDNPVFFQSHAAPGQLVSASERGC
ncbi:hypothetical protein AGR2A_Cc10292 [Agrobacterium genomosp. 2 str. CFBP 5494]|uniref:Uncharacterized protein n=1 Tax=Agrobacterium genomosp. 2 str. CFBP 5494 TaxID=1183436 RepID=A0A9W5AXX2_9HYPH|nr:hypothetical protein AGR2A_Cc10292 [Agrobacterium genomosp. 2 str. CFBP 5494]